MLKPVGPEPVLRNKRCHFQEKPVSREEAPAHCNQKEPVSSKEKTKKVFA